VHLSCFLLHTPFITLLFASTIDNSDLVLGAIVVVGIMVVVSVATAPILPPWNIDDNSILKYGLLISGYTAASLSRTGMNTKKDRFRSQFGIDPAAVVACLKDLEVEGMAPGPLLKEFFMALNWLRQYPTSRKLGLDWNLYEDIAASKAQRWMKAIAHLRDAKVVFEGFDENETWLLSVDGVHFKIHEVRTDPSTKWYSHKSHGPGLGYEFGLAIRRDVLVWFRGSLQDESNYASEHDLTKFRGGSVKDGKDKWRFDSLYNALPPGKKAIGDSGYVGEEDKITVLRDAHSPELKQFITRAKSRQEAYHTRLKSFKILAERFRHDIHLHETCVAAVVVLVQYDMVSRPLMTIR
jgi:hypothetical protein